MTQYWKKNKNKKAVGRDEIPPDVWKTRKFDDLIQLCNAECKKNTIEKWTKGDILSFPKKGDLRITKNTRGITLNTKVYHAMLLNHSQLEIEKILRKNTMVFREIALQPQRFWLSIKSSKENAQKILNLLFVDFSKSFNSIQWGKAEQILLTYGISKETVTDIMMLYKIMIIMVHSPEDNTNFFVIVAGILQGDSLG